MRARAVGLVIAIAVVVGGVGILDADAATGGFVSVVNPITQLPAGGYLPGMTCTASSQCVAVGFDGGIQAISLVGDPSTWTAAQVKKLMLGSNFGQGVELRSVACTSTSACVAVGDDGKGQPIVLVGDPSTWSGTQAKEITLNASLGWAGALASVSCTSASSCVAVGFDDNFEPLVLTGDPSTWSGAHAKELTLAKDLGEGGELRSVSCTSSTACVAVGLDGNFQPLVVSGDPSTWSGAQAQELTLGDALGDGGELVSVSCPSSSSCVAVGQDATDFGMPLVLAGDPSTWSAAQLQEITLGPSLGDGGAFLSVTCSSASSCVAGGLDGKIQPLALAGDPATWGVAQAREITLGTAFASGGELSSLVCTSASTCVASGLDLNYQPLILTGDPSTWSATQAHEVTLRGIGFGALGSPNALACVSPTSCLDVGAYGGVFSPGGPYLIHGDPASWDQASATPMTGVGRGSLYGATCPSPTFCVAVGSNILRRYVPYTLVGDPSTWDTATGQAFKLGHGGSLSAVSCTSTTWCAAVGLDDNFQPLVVTGNPSTWTSANAKEIKLSRKLPGGILYSVACTSPTSCVAVGGAGIFSGQEEPIFLAGNPANWTAKSVKEINLDAGLSPAALGPWGSLSSVACTSSSYCVGVGSQGKAGLFSSDTPLFVTGNPAKWTIKRAFAVSTPSAKPNSVGAFTILGLPLGLFGHWSISCDNARYCVAGGNDRNGAPVYISGNPTTWKRRALLRPVQNGPAFDTALFATAGCAPTTCFLGGTANGGDFVASISGG